MNTQFSEGAKAALDQKIIKACETIVKSSLGIRGGRIVSGGNMVSAEHAANSISEAELKYFNEANKGDSTRPGYYMGLVVLAEFAKTLFQPDGGSAVLGTDKLLSAVAAAASMTKKMGWETEAAPLNWDVNAAGARRATFREPEGIAAELVNAFDIGPKQTARVLKFTSGL